MSHHHDAGTKNKGDVTEAKGVPTVARTWIVSFMSNRSAGNRVRRLWNRHLPALGLLRSPIRGSVMPAAAAPVRTVCVHQNLAPICLLRPPIGGNERDANSGCAVGTVGVVRTLLCCITRTARLRRGFHFSA